MISPIAVVSSTSLLAPGAKQSVVDTQGLLNPFRGEWMLIDEIVFETYQQNKAIGNIYVELKLGTDRFMNSPVPAWLLGRDYNPGSSDNSAQFQFLDYYSWKLRNPVYVKPGEFIQPLIWNRSTHSFVVNVAMRGRSIGPNPVLPAKRYLPWVGSFLPNPTNAAFSYKSVPNDFNNPFDKPIYVSEFVGRIKDGAITDDTTIVREFLGLDTYTVVRMYDSQGRLIVRDKTPFGLLFSVIWKYWAANAEMDPHGYYTIYVDGDYSNPDGLGALTAQPLMSMIAYREV